MPFTMQTQCEPSALTVAASYDTSRLPGFTRTKCQIDKNAHEVESDAGRLATGESYATEDQGYRRQAKSKRLAADADVLRTEFND